MKFKVQYKENDVSISQTMRLDELLKLLKRCDADSIIEARKL